MNKKPTLYYMEETKGQKIGIRLKGFRKNMKIKSTEMAKVCGVSRTTIWRFENGGDLSVVALEKYVDYLKLDVYFVVK